MDDQDKLVLTELFTVIREIQINAYVQNLKRGFLQILKYISLNSKAMVISHKLSHFYNSFRFFLNDHNF